MRVGSLSVLVLFIVVIGQRASSAIDIGHNLTPTTESMPTGQWTIGNYAVAYAASDSVFIATSPWIWFNYNSINAHFKWVHPLANATRIGIFASYFESLRWAFVGDAPYDWRSSSLQLLASHEWSSDVETFLSLRSSYFWNDNRPFSIRMDSGSDAIRGQLDLTTLTRLKISGTPFQLGFEIGTVGINYFYPYLHFGASVNYMDGPWLLQAGFSYTIQWRELRESKGLRPGRVDNRVRQSPTNGQMYYYPYETALHPEMQLQYFF